MTLGCRVRVRPRKGLLPNTASSSAEPEQEPNEDLEVDEGEEHEHLEEFEAEIEAMLTEGDDDKRN